MSRNTPQIAKDVRRLRADIQAVVRSFALFHKRVIGEELIKQARRVHDAVVWYWDQPGQRLRWSEQLVHAVDLLKEDLQVAKEDAAFPKGFAQFERLYRQAEAVGAQAGAIRREQRKKHPKGQDARGDQRPSAARPETEYPRRPAGAYP